MKSSFLRPVFLLLSCAALGAAGALGACSSSEATEAPADASSTGTDSTGEEDAAAACKTSKTCEDGKVCTDGVCTEPKSCKAQSDCPFGQTCVTTGAKSVCSADSVTLTKKSKGQWGYACDPSGGIEGNPSCDTKQKFKCRGKSPTDGNAYCTRYECESDRECAGGYYCATVNTAPNAESTSLAIGATEKACIPRDYCDPCENDVDCTSKGNANTKCAKDKGGKGYCTKECSADSNCARDAQCKDGTCVPRAGTCKGDGSLCSPCKSDADCPNGACIVSEFSREMFCAVKATGKCGTDPTKDICPDKTSNLAGTGSVCSSKEYLGVPPNYCFGIVDFGDLLDTGEKDDAGKPIKDYAQQPGCYVPPSHDGGTQ